jgi:hypothetical protein
LSTNALAGDAVVANSASATFADKNVGNGKAVSVSGISISGADAGNYTLLNITAATTANITPKPITVTADAKTKVVGQPDPPLTYSVTSGSLAAGDAFSGALTRAPGENVGSYAIGQGTLAAGSNYAMTFVGANLTITSGCTAVTSVNFNFAPAVPKVGQAVNFTATAAVATLPITYTWNFGHGANVVGTSATTSHSFPLTTTVKTYAVTLTAANACTTSPATANNPVTVMPYRIYLPLILR